MLFLKTALRSNNLKQVPMMPFYTFAPRTANLLISADITLLCQAAGSAAEGGMRIQIHL
jgi:hypothetical protein